MAATKGATVLLLCAALLWCLAASLPFGEDTDGVGSAEHEEALASPDEYDPAECAALSVFPEDTIPAHRWFEEDVVPASARNAAVPPASDGEAGGRRGSRRRSRRAGGATGDEGRRPRRPRGRFNQQPVPVLVCDGEFCDSERRPDAVHCAIVKKRAKNAGPVATEPGVEWECEVVRPSWLHDNVVIHSVRPECRSTVDGSVLSLPNANELVRGHDRLHGVAGDAATTIRASAVLADASNDSERSAAPRRPALPTTLAVSHDDGTSPQEECEFELRHRRVPLHDLVALRRAMHVLDDEDAATAAIAAARETSKDGPDAALVAAEVCRIRYRVQLVYKPALIVSLAAMAFVIVVFFVMLVVGTNTRKARYDVSRGRVARELERYEDDLAARGGGGGEGATAGGAPGRGSAFDAPPGTSRRAPTRDELTRTLAAMRGELRADGSAGGPRGGGAAGIQPQGAAKQFDNAIARGLAEGLTLDEVMLREEIRARRDAAEVPPGMTASQFVRERMAARIAGDVAPHTAVSGLPTNIGKAGDADDTSPKWGPDIDAVQ